MEMPKDCLRLVVSPKSIHNSCIEAPSYSGTTVSIQEQRGGPPMQTPLVFRSSRVWPDSTQNSSELRPEAGNQSAFILRQRSTKATGLFGTGVGTEEPPLLVFSHLRWDFVTQRPQHLLTRAAG